MLDGYILVWKGQTGKCSPLLLITVHCWHFGAYSADQANHRY